MGGLVVQRFSAHFTTRNPLDHRLMQRLSGTARDVLVVAAISTINVEVVLGEFVRCFHRPPGNSSPTRRSTAGGGRNRRRVFGPKPARGRCPAIWRGVPGRVAVSHRPAEASYFHSSVGAEPIRDRVGGRVTPPVRPHHRAYGSVHGGSSAPLQIPELSQNATSGSVVRSGPCSPVPFDARVPAHGDFRPPPSGVVGASQFP